MHTLRNDLLQAMVLNEISDDYEELKLITRKVQEWCSECGAVVTDLQVKDALLALVERGAVTAYDLYNKPPIPIILPENVRNLGGYYFYQTDLGRSEHQSSSTAFDEIRDIQRAHELARGR